MMDSQSGQEKRPVNPRRRTRTKMEIFQEVYLPFLIVAASVLVIITLIISIASGGNRSEGSDDSKGNSSVLQQQAQELLSQAEALAAVYDYDGAIKLLNTFPGQQDKFPQIKDAIDTYTSIKNDLIEWTADQVPNFSFHVLIADLDAALSDKEYGQSGSNQYNRNFITTQEFSEILQQLYDGGYVLVDLSDLYDYSTDGFSEKKISLPPGKKPILLTQTHCSYYTYMETSHAFASKLCYNGTFYNEMVTADGQTITGNFDLVPILEAFISSHPGFSYQGARAILAFSGSDGVFGYRVTSSQLSDSELQQEQADAAAVVSALREAGYTIACYTYGNINYNSHNAAAIDADVKLWQERIAPIVGRTNVFVFAQESDIGSSYEGNDKFDILYDSGFRFFLGNTSFLFQETKETYVRHNRLMVTASTLKYNSQWFSSYLNAENLVELLDPRRSTIPK